MHTICYFFTWYFGKIGLGAGLIEKMRRKNRSFEINGETMAV